MRTKNEVKAEYDSCVEKVEAVIAQAKFGDNDWDFGRATVLTEETPEDKHEAFLTLNTRLGELGAELDKYQVLEDAERTIERDRAARAGAVKNSGDQDVVTTDGPQRTGEGDGGPQLGHAVMNSAIMKAYTENGQKTAGEIPDVEMNTLIGRRVAKRAVRDDGRLGA